MGFCLCFSSIIKTQNSPEECENGIGRVWNRAFDWFIDADSVNFFWNFFRFIFLRLTLFALNWSVAKSIQTLSIYISFTEDSDITFPTLPESDYFPLPLTIIPRSASEHPSLYFRTIHFKKQHIWIHRFTWKYFSCSINFYQINLIHCYIHSCRTNIISWNHQCTIQYFSVNWIHQMLIPFHFQTWFLTMQQDNICIGVKNQSVKVTRVTYIWNQLIDSACVDVQAKTIAAIASKNFGFSWGQFLYCYAFALKFYSVLCNTFNNVIQRYVHRKLLCNT